MERKTLARWLVSAALGCFVFLWAGSASAQEGNVVQGQNGSTESTASSEAVTATNNMTFGAGPRAGGDAPSSAAQIGDNSGTAVQQSEARSGDAAAGSQVFGVVGGGATIQAQNSSAGASATSEAVTVSNNMTVNLGPTAGGTGSGAANAGQIGDNRLDASQSVVAASGDAVAGSQVVGIVGWGDHTVQIQNSSDDETVATSGAVDVTVDSELYAGPSAFADGEGAANASQIGDNDAVLTQSTDVRSGDAVAGSQVVGIVGNGSSTVQGQSSSTGADALSGDVFAAPIATVTVGPSASAGAAAANASQNGDNTADVDQSIELGSGDAVAGSQVFGLVADAAGHVTVQNQQSSEDDTATSGDVGSADDDVVVTVAIGPSAASGEAAATAGQIGDNNAAVSQTVELTSGDAVAGSQVTGIVAGNASVTVQNQNASAGSDATSGDVVGDDLDILVSVTAGPAATSDETTAMAAQEGDNDLSADQHVAIASGDAVAGSQVTGVVAWGGADVTIQSQNTSDGDSASSGTIWDVEMDIAANAGPTAETDGEDAGTAMASQIGDNAVASSQSVEISTGDAVAGSQVTGVVADGGETTVQSQNSSTDSESVSGSVDVEDVEIGVQAGPQAFSLGASAILSEAEAGTAQATQNGDNVVIADQRLALGSGDAVAGSQVTGVVTTGGDVTVQNQNVSDGDYAESGEIDVDDVSFEAEAGPEAVSVALAAILAGAESGNAQASQNGDNLVVSHQHAAVATGDAVAGSQVTGVVSGSSTTIQNQNSSTGAEAFSGDVDIDDVTSEVEAGPEAISLALAAILADAEGGNAQAAQDGDNVVTGTHHVGITSGDAVAGSQVTGVVNSGADVTVQNQNVSDGDYAETGDVDVDDVTFEVEAGPQATSVAVAAILADATAGNAQASQFGDNDVDVSQSVEVSSGDAVAGGQVTGIVASRGAVVTVQAQNSSEDNEATSGDVDADASIELVVGPESESIAVAFFLSSTETGNAAATQNGDNSAAVDQHSGATSGDAVAGSQVVGVVTDGGDVTVQIQNFAEGSLADTGDVTVSNTVSATVGPDADGGAEGNASAMQFGDNELGLSQSATASSGDAVAGAQVVGAVGGDHVAQLQNTDDGSEATTADADVTNVATGVVGPEADGGTGNANAVQNGDSALWANQSGDARTGDAVAGGQVVGLVGFGAGTTSTSGGASGASAEFALLSEAAI